MGNKSRGDFLWVCFQNLPIGLFVVVIVLSFTVKGLFRFFFLLKFEYSAVPVSGCVRCIKMRIKGCFA